MPAIVPRGLLCLFAVLLSAAATADSLPSVLGTWKGTYFTDGLTRNPQLGEWGGPPKTYSVTLTIDSQSEYVTHNEGIVVSTFSGDMSEIEDGYFLRDIPVTGFVSREGIVKLSFYQGPFEVHQFFQGRLTTFVGMQQIEGSWTIYQVSGGVEFTQIGTLSVKQRGYFCIPCILRVAEDRGDGGKSDRRGPALLQGVRILSRGSP